MKKIDSARILAILVIFLAMTYFYLSVFTPRSIPTFIRFGVIRQPLTILILGTDVNYNAETKQPMPEMPGRADTIILARINPITSQINLLSIPRDTYITIPGHGQQKINAATVYGGIPLLKETVENFTQRKIDYYIEMKPTIVTSLVNAVGGITVFVEKDMFYEDKIQDLKINLKKGWQKLNGEKAHQYIRFRYDWRGDIGRVERQQKFFKALVKSLMKPGNLIRAPFTVSALLNKLETDLPIAKTLRLMNFSRFASVKSVMASGEATFVNKLSVWQPDQVAIDKTLAEYF